MSTSGLGTMHESQNKRDGRRLTAPQTRKRTKTAAPPEDACASSSRCTRGSEAEDWRSAKDGWAQLESEGHVKFRTRPQSAPQDHPQPRPCPRLRPQDHHRRCLDDDWRSAKDGWAQLEREGHVKTRTPSDLSMAWHYLVSAAPEDGGRRVNSGGGAAAEAAAAALVDALIKDTRRSLRERAASPAPPCSPWRLEHLAGLAMSLAHLHFNPDTIAGIRRPSEAALALLLSEVATAMTEFPAAEEYEPRYLSNLIYAVGVVLDAAEKPTQDILAFAQHVVLDGFSSTISS